MRSHNRAALSALMLLGLAVAACESDTAAPATDRADLVMAVASLSMTMRSGTPGMNQTYTQVCPDGGRLVVEGSDSYSDEDGIAVNTWDQVMRHEDCAMTVDGRVVIANGEMHVFGEARFGPAVNGIGTLAMQESGQQGSMTTTADGESRSCDLDLTHVFDREANQYHITGSACGRPIDLHVPLPSM